MADRTSAFRKLRVLFLGACAAALMFSSEAASARSGAAVAAPTAAPPAAPSQVTPPAPGPGPAIRHHHPRGYRAYLPAAGADRKSTRLNSSHQIISYAVFCLQK